MDKKQAFKECMSIYYEWFQEQRGFPPRIDASDGAALKKIISYLFTLTENGDEAVDSFRVILSRWNELSTFYQKGIRLRQINGNLVNIVDALKNGKNDTGVSDDYLSRVVRDLQS